MAFAVPSAADTTVRIGLKLTEGASGTVTDSRDTYTVSAYDIINSSANYNITLQNSSTVYNCSYLTFDMSGLRVYGGYTGRYDVTMHLQFSDEDQDLSDVVTGGEAILGLWIPNYRENYDFNIDSVYFDGGSTLGGTGFDTEYLGFSSIGCKLFKLTFRPDPNGNNSPLSQFRNIVVQWHWTGNPADYECSFVFGNSSYVIVQSSSNADIDYAIEKNDEIRTVADQISDDLDLDMPDISNTVQSISDDMSVLSNEYEIITPPYSNNNFISWYTGAGVTCLSFCFMGYILFGKKG